MKSCPFVRQRCITTDCMAWVNGCALIPHRPQPEMPSVMADPIAAAYKAIKPEEIRARAEKKPGRPRKVK